MGHLRGDTSLSPLLRAEGCQPGTSCVPSICLRWILNGQNSEPVNSRDSILVSARLFPLSPLAKRRRGGAFSFWINLTWSETWAGIFLPLIGFQGPGLLKVTPCLRDLFSVKMQMLWQREYVQNGLFYLHLAWKVWITESLKTLKVGLRVYGGISDSLQDGRRRESGRKHTFYLHLLTTSPWENTCFFFFYW